MLNRKYSNDFEVYGDEATFGDEGQVNIFLSVK
jgi:predicted transcriptional regulator YdeE